MSNRTFHLSESNGLNIELSWGAIYFFDMCVRMPLKHFICLLSWKDQHLQWFLLWLLLSKQSLQTKDVDWSLDWLVNCLLLASTIIFYHPRILQVYKNTPAFACWSSIVSYFAYRFTQFGGPVPHRPAEDMAFSVARFIQKGGSFINYYMVSCFGNLSELLPSWIQPSFICLLRDFSIMEGQILAELLVVLSLQQVTIMMLLLMNMVCT